MIRRKFIDLSNDERDTLAAAFNHVNNDGLIAIHATTHAQFFSGGIHWRPQFLPWHRYFLRKLELALQEFSPDVMLPYWDWTQSNSQDLEISPWKEIFGGRDNAGGKFDTGWNYERNDNGNWTTDFSLLPTMDQILTELSAITYRDYRRVEGLNDGEMGSHVHAHPWVGGNMSSGDSPKDPLFYLHHCNLDRLWSIWQLNNPSADQYDSVAVIASDGNAPLAPIVEIDGKMPEATDPWQNIPGFSGATPKEMQDHSKLGFFSPESGYAYQQDTILEAAWTAEFGTSIVTHTEPLAEEEPVVA